MSELEATHDNEPVAEVYLAANMMDASFAQQALEAQEIQCIVQSSVTPGLLPVEFGPLGGVGRVRILVLESQKARADEIIKAMLADRQNLPDKFTNGGDDTEDEIEDEKETT